MPDVGTTNYNDNDLREHDYRLGTPEQPLNDGPEQPSPCIQSSDKEIPRDEYKTPSPVPLRRSKSQQVMSIWYKSPWIEMKRKGVTRQQSTPLNNFFEPTVYSLYKERDGSLLFGHGYLNDFAGIDF